MPNEPRPPEQEDTASGGPTPGPWGVRDTHDNCTEINSPLFEDPYNCIANVNARWMWKGDGTDPVQVANARLIAASPDLKQAVEEMAKFLGWDLLKDDGTVWAGTRRTAQDAYRKALGVNDASR